MAVITSAPTEAQEEASARALVRYREMVPDLARATGAGIGEVRDAQRKLLGQVRVGLQVSNGSGGRIP